MANTSSAKKSIRVIASKTAANRNRRSRVRTFIKRVDAAIEAGDQKLANTSLKAAESELMSAVSKGVFKKESASRKISRLNAQIKKLAA